MFKDKRNSGKSTTKEIQAEPEQFIIQKIARIDGHETIKKYKKCELLGKGGFANCYTTQNTDTKRKAATKIIEKDLLTSQKTKLRLLNQIRLHKTLHHPNVVGFEHYFEDKSNVYIFLELCENMSLNEVIKVRDYFTTPEIQFFILGIVQGLKYLHGKSVVHRDLKLGNIFLDKKFNIKLGDFGLATKLEFRKELKRTICGTPNYIAPEVLNGNSYSFEVDIWSIGVILYTLYYTIPPFETEEAATTYQRIKKCEYVIPKYMTVPEEANDLIRRILVKNPADRPTLDQILQSDFMKLGGQIFKELPAICSRKTPTKKDFLGLPHERIQNIISKAESAGTCLDLKQDKTIGKLQIAEYIVRFEALEEQDHYFYLTNKGVASVTNQKQTLIKTEQGYFFHLDKQKVSAPRRVDDHELKSILNYKLKVHRSSCNSESQVGKRDLLMDTSLFPSDNKFLWVKRVSKQKSMFLVRLSNQTVQLFFQDETTFLVTKQSEVYSLTHIYPFTLNLIEKQEIDKARTGNDEHSFKSPGRKKGIEKAKAKYIKVLLDQIAKLKNNLEGTQNCIKVTKDENLMLPKNVPCFKKSQSQSLPFRQINN